VWSTIIYSNRSEKANFFWTDAAFPEEDLEKQESLAKKEPGAMIGTLYLLTGRCHSQETRPDTIVNMGKTRRV